MRGLRLCEELLAQVLTQQAERHDRWSMASHKVGGLLKAPGVMIDIIQVGRLDCVVSDLESALPTLLKVPSPLGPGLSTDFTLALAKAWLSLAYECMRVIKQRLLSDPDATRRAFWTQELSSSFAELERVRMEQLKREIAGGGKLGRIEMFLEGEDERPPLPYLHGRTVLHNPLAIRPSDGSIVWQVFSRETGESEELYRRDMSDRLLAALNR